ncbi:MAG: hypothetical protein ABJ205_00505 [Erythrobacter sp.]|uniref:hypothetical protein n=1 Tax=Erythrobacter sp. TaxID=1042 RepID=UPI0032647D5A
MISLPSDFTSAPVLPASGTAPKELITKTNFPRLLDGIEASDATSKEGLAQDGFDLELGAQKSAGEPIEIQAATQQHSGKFLPQSGTTLPLSKDAPLNQDWPVLGEQDLEFPARESPFGVDQGLIGPNAFLATPLQGQEASRVKSSSLDVYSSDIRFAEEVIAQPKPGTPVQASAEAQPQSVGMTGPDGHAVPPNSVEPVEIAPPSNRDARAESPPVDPAQPQNAIRTEAAALMDNGARRLKTAPDTGPSAEPRVAAQSNEKLHQAEVPDAPSNSAAALATQSASQANLVANPEAPQGRFVQGRANGAGDNLRVQTIPKIALLSNASQELIQGANVDPLQLAVLNVGGPDAGLDLDPDRPKAPFPAAASNVAQSSGQTLSQAQPPVHSQADTSALQTLTSQLQANAAPPPVPTNTPAPIVDAGAPKAAQQLENAIEQLAETRSAAQANKPELTVRHQEFGAITMRLETTAGDLRATLSARDPGFVPAIQAALAERSVAASSETAGGNANRSNDQAGSNSQSQTAHQSSTSGGASGQSHGQGWSFGGTYGSSTGSGQGTSQPYSGQTEGRDEESGSDPSNRRLIGGDGPEGEGEIFA